MTTPWLQFLEQHNVPTDAVPGLAPLTNFVAPLTDLGLIAATGDDAATFLHNQLTNDVEHLGDTEARLAGYCSPKGRLLATMLIWKSTDGILLQLSHDLQPAIQKRLKMFVLRAKATLTDANDQLVSLGLVGNAATAALTPWFPTMPAAPYAKVESDAGTLIRCLDSPAGPRYQWIAPQAVAEQAWQTLTRTLTATTPHAWRLAEIQAGVPHVTLATQEQFVPQMINFEVLGGVNFKKGCYPGQEIVARSQYLGKLKRRMQIACIDGFDATPGMDVFSANDPDQPCGMIVNAEAANKNQTDCLVEIKSASLDTGAICLGSASGPRLHFKPLPYVLIDVT